jgi:hypothetical protein
MIAFRQQAGGNATFQLSDACVLKRVVGAARSRPFTLKWSRQPVITTKQQNLWKAVLEAAFILTGVVLSQPLGEWTGRQTQFGKTSTIRELNGTTSRDDMDDSSDKESNASSDDENGD